ncbi:hypothetical protein GVN24_20985 [Rhizobium sp. CRIBSB]|nr:hypothetical protein [Rhizobium sp. CRIBSB]
MIRCLILLAAASVLFCGPSAQASQAVLAAPPARVIHTPGDNAALVERRGDGFFVTWWLDREAPVWVLRESSLLRETRRPWREERWIVLTPGVVLERVGDYDVLYRPDGGPIPRQVEVAMRPAVGDLEAAYDPTLLFTDGSVAFYSEQFDLIPVVDLQAAHDLPRDLNGVETPVGPMQVTWRDDRGPVLMQGRREALPTTRSPDTYVLFGDIAVSESARLVTVVDPALPAWISTGIEAFAPRVIDYFANRLGPALRDKPMVMVSWTGPTSGLTSMGGSVLPGLISMTFEGEGVLTATDQVTTASQWFIAHESAHFWLGQRVRYARSRDAWITEGGADLMAIRALKALDPGYDDRAELQKAVDDCVELTTGRSLESAETRGEHRAYYACGAVFALAAEGAAVGRDDWFDVLAPLLETDDGILTRDEWLAALAVRPGGPELVAQMQVLLDTGSPDPRVQIERLLRGAGISLRREQGRLLLL